MPNYQEPKLNQHTHSFSSTRSPQQMDEGGLARLASGAKNWGPDLLALPGDIWDAIAYSGRKIAQGQFNRPVPSQGAGEAIRRWATKSKPRETTELSASYEETGPETAARLLNPLLAMSPLKALALAAGISPGAVEGATPLMAGVVKEKGGNWLTPKWKSLIRSLKYRNVPERMEPFTYEPNSGEYWNPDTGEVFSPRQAGRIKRDMAINSWIQGPLQKYLEQRAGTPSDEIRQLMDQGISHMDINDMVPVATPGLLASRRLHAPHGDTLATTPLGQLWEDMIDSAIIPYKARDLKYGIQSPENPPWVQKISEDIPWLLKTPDETPVYKASEGVNADGLGFPGITRAIDRAIEEGTLRPDNLNKLSVSDSVKLKRSQDLADLKAMEEEATNSLKNPALHKLKEYPDGLAWYQIKPQPHRELTLQELDKLVRDQLRNSGKRPEDPDWESVYEARKALIEPSGPGPIDLESALKFEGNSMGHCVGHYCDDVDSGNSSIYTLRDAKGNPHVTIETKADDNFYGDAYNKAYDEIVAENPGLEEESDRFRDLVSDRVLTRKAPSYIAQIKGKQDVAPVEAYQPLVTDFIKNLGDWTKVYDIQNTGVYDTFTPTNLSQRIKDRIHELYPGRDTSTLGAAFYKEALRRAPSRYLTEPEIMDFLNTPRQ